MAVARVLSLFVAAYAAMITLQGCGDGGGGSSTANPNTTKKGPTTTTTTTTTLGPRTAPLTAADAAKYLNEQWSNFDKDDESSPIGAVIDMRTDFQFYCKCFGTQCFNGNADCRASASLYNHAMMVDKSGNVAPYAHHQTGVIFNTSMVRTTLGKCSFQFDGATGDRLNGGCGRVAPAANCSDRRSAYYNLDPDTYSLGDVTATGGKLCTDKSEWVTKDHCDSFPGSGPSTPSETQCYFKGAAWYQGAGEDQIWKMIEQRVGNQGRKAEFVAFDNEIVIDNNVLHDQLVKDPAVAVLAMLYTVDQTNPLTTKANKEHAEKMASDMASKFDLSPPVPAVGLKLNTRQNPFTADAPVETVVA